MKINTSRLFLITLIVLCIHADYSFAIADNKTQAKEQQNIEKQELKTKKQEQCISLTNEQSAALVAQDWENLERLAKDYLSKCRGFISSQELSDRAVNITIAYYELGRFKQAIVSADACIKIYYGNSGCHILKAKSLFALGNRTAAIKTLDISDRIAHHALEGAKHDLERASSELDKELYGSFVNKFESELQHIEAIRSKYAKEP